MIQSKNTVYALAFGAHPDDVELCASSTLLKIMQEGHSVAVCDLTLGELGTRGNAKLRKVEAAEATRQMNYTRRISLNLGDGTFENTHENRLEVIKIIRYFRPTVVFANPPEERHPDHKRASSLVSDSVFYSGLSKIKTKFSKIEQSPYRPTYMLYYIHDRFTMPSIIVDVSATFEESRKAVLAFKSQFYSPKATEPETYISRLDFLDSIEARAKVLGEAIGAKYGEGFILKKTPGVFSFYDLFPIRNVIN
ncbi:hypothetical protein CHS0354_023833 [Potamilus streckersoni]|uniref:N-acetylglucosaminylphosphatidylinositol deacetylase n=1 Tax=Potamilus streckersoni TaxID=2493646 RepID=A0AAE0RZ60_9BIVA|nr:hypothetical protein CHS0354_023833 [Potamilus streckersoni]